MSCVHHLVRGRRAPRRAKIRAWGHYRENILSWSGNWLWVCYDPRYGWVALWFSPECCYSALLPIRRSGGSHYAEESSEAE